MANRWTGGFDAAIALAPSGANSLLAAIHRKGHAPAGEPHSGPHLLHNLAVNLPLPQSAATHGLRGHLEVQLSTPSVSIPDGPPGRAGVSIDLYAWFQQALGSNPAPEFLHGTLRFTTPISIVECAGSTLAEIRAGSGALDVSFTPAAGTTLSPQQKQLVEDAVRDVLEKAIGPVHHRVASLGSGEFAVDHVAFRTQRVGARSAFELLLSFGEETGPPPQPGAPTELFLGASEDVALALGREFLTAKLLDAARGPLTGISVNGSKWHVDFQAAPDPSTLKIELHPGLVRATIEGSGSLSPGGSFRFRLRQDFGMTTSGGNLRLTLLGEPGLTITQANTLLDIVFGLFKGRIVDKLAVAASSVIAIANAQLNDLVDRSITDLADELGTPGVSLRMLRATIDADAVVLGGAIDLGATKPAVASFKNAVVSTSATTAFHVTKFNAFESWVPGGTVTGYKWLQVGTGGTVGGSEDVPHRFVLRLEPLTDVATAGEHYGWPPYTWCLEVRGTQFVGALDPVQVTRTVCGISVVVPNVDVALDAGLLTLQVSDGEGGVVADLAPWARYRAHAFANDRENRGALLVHRAGADAREAAAVLKKALSGPMREARVFATIIAEKGLAGMGGSDASRELAGIAMSDDPNGAWRKRFGLEREGTTVIVGAGGKELWRDGGPLRLERLLEVLKKLDLADARPPRLLPVRLGLEHGFVAPDFFFQCTLPDTVGDFGISTTKLRGQDLELCFWTTWSSASLEELRRRVAAGGRAVGERTILVNDGEDPEVAARFLKQQGLKFAHTATDPQRRLARRYGISCWPTVVQLDAEGRVAAARFGVEHAHSGGKDAGCGATPPKIVAK